MKLEKDKIGLVAILVVSILAVVVVFFQDSIAQDLNYHLFHDERTFFGIPNFWNVISNLPFLFVGLWGGQWVVKATQHNLLRELKLAYFFLFLGISLVAVGSGYYHLWPNNVTLVWDRMPMTIAFMSLFSVVIGEFISVRFSQLLLFPLLIFGILSVIYWHITEGQGEGDLRLYVLVQFLPMLIIPMILLLFKPVYTLTRGYWLLLFSYLLAKALEYFDPAMFDILPLLSGHSLKHVTAACGVFFLIRAYKHREPTYQKIQH
ncbi:ceramidase domain-containing protein [uncultured Muriicola sp.]|uniref:ceramidase domain-containing protein n=1 Tax=uncultured Muriicola sp. TaxID=1583102 RepID=UPI002620D4E7|nr:ceramidase domain-containing protein [uncultured Muriicola sp.]